jgi:hypothetical protein
MIARLRCTGWSTCASPSLAGWPMVPNPFLTGWPLSRRLADAFLPVLHWLAPGWLNKFVMPFAGVLMTASPRLTG